MSELTVDFWVALSVIPMVIALGIYIWLSKRFDRLQEREARRYEELVQKVQAPLDGSPPQGNKGHNEQQPLKYPGDEHR